ncbi:leucine rich repeat-containing protein [Cystoisospora suis]|uniref:Leucine rich repeat-containing protein n=1 Tax=Cystoisospora suis TaxID=483139 RepID=A0A2C6L4Z5_9APIC|nr:leucine rich repeat-containing protein [Cystoisospora suis]
MAPFFDTSFLAFLRSFFKTEVAGAVAREALLAGDEWDLFNEAGRVTADGMNLVFEKSEMLFPPGEVLICRAIIHEPVRGSGPGVFLSWRDTDCGLHLAAHSNLAFLRPRHLKTSPKPLPACPACLCQTFGCFMEKDDHVCGPSALWRKKPIASLRPHPGCTAENLGDPSALTENETKPSAASATHSTASYRYREGNSHDKYWWLLGPDMVLPLYHAVIEYVTETSPPAATRDTFVREGGEEEPQLTLESPPANATSSSVGAVSPLPAPFARTLPRRSASCAVRPLSRDSDRPSTDDAEKESCLLRGAEENSREDFGSFLEILT